MSTSICENIPFFGCGCLIIDSTPPSLSCASNQPNLPTDSGVNTASFAYANDSSFNATDIVDGDLRANVSCSVPSPHNYPIGLTTVTCGVLDSAGNAAVNCSFNVTVSSPNAPNITACPSAISLDADIDSSNVSVTWDTVSALDKDNNPMSVPTPSLSGATSSGNNGSKFEFGVTLVQYNFTDTVSGLSSLCEFNVTVTDGQGPTVVCPDNRVNVEATSSSGAVQTYSANASDVIDTALGSVSCVPASGSTFGLSNSSVVCSVADASGNQGNCTFWISVVGRCMCLYVL